MIFQQLFFISVLKTYRNGMASSLPSLKLACCFRLSHLYNNWRTSLI